MTDRTVKRPPAASKVTAASVPRLAALRASRGRFRGKLSSVDEFIARKQDEKTLEHGPCIGAGSR